MAVDSSGTKAGRPTPPRPSARKTASHSKILQRPTPPARPTRQAPVLVSSSVAVFLPGAGHLLQGRFNAGLVWFGSAFLLCGAMATVTAMFPRFWKAMEVMGLPAEATVWTLAALAGLFAFVHVASVISARAGHATHHGLHPSIACIASAVVPGWGQTLNGDLVRAGLSLAAAWTTVAVWYLASAPFEALLATHSLHLPDVLSTAVTGPAKFVLVSTLWSLAIYDAGASACWRRR